MKEKTKHILTPLGKEIKKKLIDLDMTQGDLAKRVGTSVKYLNHIMYGRRSGYKYIDDIIRVLNLQSRQKKKII